MRAATRRLIGIALALAVLFAGVLLWKQHLRSADEVALAGFSKELQVRHLNLSERFKKMADTLGEKANAAAGNKEFELLSEVSLQEPSSVLNFSNTLNDSVKTERTWASFRALGETVISLGGRNLVEPASGVAVEVVTALRSAEAGERNSLVFLSQQVPSLVGAAPVSTRAKDGSRGALALVAALTSDMVLPELLEGEAVSIGAATWGAEDSLALVKGGNAVQSCCFRAEVAPGVSMTIGRSPEAALAQSRERAKTLKIPALAGTGVLMLLALMFGFWAPRAVAPSPDVALLRETADQLRASQDELRRLSQQMMVPNQTGERARDLSDALGSTQTSAVPSRYEVVAPLGEGGMAKVSVAVLRGAEGFKRYFVVKRLRPELMGTQEVVNQFIDEARLGASLVNSNIVPIFDFGRDAEGYYLAQEYILGRDVDALLQRSLQIRHRALETSVVLYVAQEALKALSYAHRKTNDAGRPLGLVHRDVSPNNLMVSLQGELKLLDFGIVKSEDRVTQTQAGMVKGNLFFMSPEQAKALPVDQRSDLFSLGLVLFYAASGVTLYSGATSYELMMRAAQGIRPEDRPLLLALGTPLAELLQNVLTNEPSERFADAETFSRAIAKLSSAASSTQLQALMSELFEADLETERQKFMTPEARS
jgi:Protein kinase domain